MSDLLTDVAEYVVQTTPTPEQIRANLDALEAQMKTYPQVEIVPRHYFADGLYAREITIPKGTLLTGKIHHFQHLNIISQGEITVLTEQGPKRVKAPCTLVSPPGTKRLGYAHEETVWTTVHANPENLRDTDQLEAVLVYESHASLEQEGGLCLTSP